MKIIRSWLHLLVRMRLRRWFSQWKKNTAPGPDHLPVEFFQACWDIIKGELENMFTEF